MFVVNQYALFIMTIITAVYVRIVQAAVRQPIKLGAASPTSSSHHQGKSRFPGGYYRYIDLISITCLVILTQLSSYIYMSKVRCDVYEIVKEVLENA